LVSLFNFVLTKANWDK